MADLAAAAHVQPDDVMAGLATPAHVQPDERAPREALGAVTAPAALGIGARLRALGIAVSPSRFTPAGAAVRLDVHHLSLWLDSHDVAALRIALERADREAGA